MAAKRDRSVGRRISTFFGTSQPTPPSPSRTHPTPTSDRPASRGRTLTTRPHKGSENLLTPDGAFQPPTSDHLSPNDLMPPPPVPFAADSPRSRTSSPVMRSRPSTSSGLRPNSQTSSPVASSAHPPGFHNPAHASTAPETDEVPPPILGPPRTKTSSLETEKKLKRRSWMPGTKEKSSPTSKLASAPNALQAWITGHADKVAYNLDPLIQGQRLEELWEDTAGLLASAHLRYLSNHHIDSMVQIHSFISSHKPLRKVHRCAYPLQFSHRHQCSRNLPTATFTALAIGPPLKKDPSDKSQAPPR